MTTNLANTQNHRKLFTLAFFVTLPGGRGLPLLINGPPGATKTYEVERFAQEMGVTFVHVSPSQRGEGYFGAAPCRGEYKGEQVLDFPPPREIVDLDDEGAGLILVDELRTSPRSVRPALLGIINERRFGQKKLKAGIRIMAASNSASESSGAAAPLDPATANRFCHTSMEDPTVEEAATYFANCVGPRDYAPVPPIEMKARNAERIRIEEELNKLRPKIAPIAAAMITAFLRSTSGTWTTCKTYEHKSELRAQPTVSDPASDGPWGSPRTWAMAFELLVTHLSLAELCRGGQKVFGHTFAADLSTDLEFQTAFDGLVGPMSQAFCAAVSGYNIIQPEEWLDGKSKLVDGDSSDRIYATFSAGAAWLIGQAAGASKMSQKEAQLLSKRAETFFALSAAFSRDLTYGATLRTIECKDARVLTSGKIATQVLSEFVAIQQALGQGN